RTDYGLRLTLERRQVGVVGKFVEFFGDGLDQLSLGDRGMIANMAPEYGATAVFFPVDRHTTDYMRMTGRSEEHIALVAAYNREQKLCYDEWVASSESDAVLTLDLQDVKPAISGPSNPEDHLDLDVAATAFLDHHQRIAGRAVDLSKAVPVEGEPYVLHDGDVVIAAITSCTNTANAVNMLAAGLV